MTITVQDLNDLPQATVDQQRELLVALVQEFNENIELKRGTVHDHVLELSAILAGNNQENIDLVRRSCSLQEITDDPTLADDDVVDRVISNYRLTRKTGSQATGTIRIVISSLIPLVIPVESVFTINGVTFTSDRTWTARTDAALVVDDSDVLISADGSNYSFTITATASAVGTDGNVKRSSVATPADTIPTLVTAFADSDFTGGVNEETNTELLARLQTGLATKAWSNRVSSEAMILNETQFANVLDLSIIGHGDGEMIRDQHSLWPGSMGGRVDLYLRSQAVWQTSSVTKTAVLVSKAGSTGTWRINLTRDDAPGFYQVDEVRLIDSESSAAGFAVASDTRDTDLTEDTDDGIVFIPDIETAVEGTYSRFQTAEITFVDTVTDASALTVSSSTQEYNVIIRSMPLVAELQEFLAGRSVRPTMGDILVKAAVPCFTSITFTANVAKGTTVPETATIQSTVANAINNLGFTNKLSGSFIAQAVHGLIPTGLIGLSNMDILGLIRRPAGTTLQLRDSVEVTIPDEGSAMVSGRTTSFLCDPDNVAVTVTLVDVPVI